MDFYFNKKDRITISFGAGEIEIEKDPYDCETRDERLIEINKIFSKVSSLCNQEQSEMLSDFNLSWVILRKLRNQVTFLKKSQRKQLPIGTILYHASKYVDKIKTEGLKSTDKSGDGVLYNEDRIYFATSKLPIEEDRYLVGREILSFEYDGSYDVFEDIEFDDGTTFYAAAKEQFTIKI